MDIDFQDDRREEVIEYVRRKYGDECVSNIITYGSMKSKSAIRDVARIYDHPPAFGDSIAKLVPDKVKNLKQALEESEEFSNMYNAKPDVKAVVDTAITIEGLPKSTGKHACGVIIAPEAITNFIPQVVVMDETGEKDEKGNKIYEEVMVTQLDMAECEEMGLLKMDFLGLRNLSVIAGTLELINKNRLIEGLEPLTMDDIPITDPYAFKHIQQGNTIGVFQLESGGMTNLVSETYPDVDNYIKEYVKDKKVNEKGIGVFDERFDPLFERLIALISLYRPGPMDEIPNYLHNMNNPEDVTYDAPQLKNILSNTYGIIVYQEQVMHAVRQMAGFSAGQSDIIRKAMGKFCSTC